MKVWKRVAGVWILVLGLAVVGFTGWAQFTFPFGPQDTGPGQALDFGQVRVGTTATATYTFKLLETSDTPATVTITQPNAPFSSDAPTSSFTLSPGQSITFNVRFTPSAVRPYSDSFSITTRGGIPVQTKRQTITLTGEGVAGGTIPGSGDTYFPPIDPGDTYFPPITDSTEDIAKVEAKLDAIGPVLDELRQKLDNLGWWLGRLTVGYPIDVEPRSTNPIPETNLWWLLESLEAKLDRLLYVPFPGTTTEPNIEDLLAQLEAKLDVLIEQPGDVTITEINIAITEIYAIIIDITQLIININQVTININPLIVNINTLVININQLIINLGANIGQLETKLDRIEAGLLALQRSNRRIEAKLDLLLGYPPTPAASLITLTVEPVLASAADHSAILDAVPGAVEGGAEVNIYWLGRDNWIPGVTDAWYLDTVVANPDGSFSFTKDGWGSTWPVWCDVTQSNVSGEGAAARVLLSTVMILM
ncbi:hypothetical protein ACFLTM_04140 [Candidatus Bipolaricaulota bacterium]